MAVRVIAIIVLVLLGAGAEASQGDEQRGPRGVYLTWLRDPVTSLTVRWLAPRGEGASRVVFGTRSSPLAIAEGHRQPFQETGLDLHSVELRDLSPGTEYHYVVEGSPLERRFRTMPAEAAGPIRFVVGGDVYQGEPIDERIYRSVAARDPAFVVLGGDIVYDNGDPARADRWVLWLETWSRLMVGPGGHSIPMVAVIGNHELPPTGIDRSPAEAPMFYQVFRERGSRSYQVLDFGRYLSMFLLDSGHTEPIPPQAAWLERRLAARENVTHTVAVYHVPAWPSVRGLEDWVSPRVRESWVPLLERHGVDAVYEHHDHAYKRTHRIRGGRVDPGGVLYIGDGAWGVPLRSVHDPKETWYLARAESINHFIVTTIDGARMTHQARDVEGRVFDEFE